MMDESDYQQLLEKRYRQVEKEVAIKKEKLDKADSFRACHGLNCKYSDVDTKDITSGNPVVFCNHPLIKGAKETPVVCVGSVTSKGRIDEDAKQLCGDERRLSDYRRSWPVFVQFGISLLVLFGGLYLFVSLFSHDLSYFSFIGLISRFMGGGFLFLIGLACFRCSVENYKCFYKYMTTSEFWLQIF